MPNTFRISPDFRFKITRVSDRPVEITFPFISGFHYYHYDQKKGFDESIELALKENPRARMFIEFNQPEVSVSKELIYPRTGLASYILQKLPEKTATNLCKSKEQIPLLGVILSRIARADLDLPEIERLFSEQAMESVYNALLHGGAFVPAEVTQKSFHRAGIHRLQHAGLLFNSGRTSLITDPHFHSLDEPEGLTSTVSFHELPKIDAILLTHSHGDHYDLASIALFDRSTTIFFPRSERATILCPDIEAELRLLNFTDIRPLDPDYEWVKVGDMEIMPTAFWGEQATVEEDPFWPGVRNTGLTYVVKMNGKNSWVIADSGTEKNGSAIGEAEIVRRKAGEIHTVFSCFRDFFNNTPFYLNIGLTWLSLSTAQMRRLPSRTESLTLGPSGLSRLLENLPGASVYPYAHSWSSVGTKPVSDDEHEKRLKELLADPERVKSWSIGDCIQP